MQNLWDQAGEYAALAVQKFSLLNRERDDELDDAHDFFRIHFLFPNLHEGARAELHAIRLVQRDLLFTYGLLIPNPQVKAAAREMAEQNVKKRRQAFVLMVSVFKDAYWAGLTTIQTQLLEERYFIAFPKGST